VAIANIWGMESVLGDRCLTLILEKSQNPKITKLIERFDKDVTINKVKNLFNNIREHLISLTHEKDFSLIWNSYIQGELREKSIDNYTFSFIKRANELNIEGRNLELLIPLYFLAYLIDDETLTQIFKISQEIVKEREEEDYFENNDKILLRFLFEKIKGDLTYLQYISTTLISNQFKDYLGEGSAWINPKWIGKALKRMKVLKGRKRESSGIKVLIDFEKIKGLM
jgi:hypothetical protein